MTCTSGTHHLACDCREAEMARRVVDARREALEEAAKMCEDDGGGGHYMAGRIRALLATYIEAPR